MSALVEFVGLDQLSLAALPAPVVIRLPEPISDDQLLAFSDRNRPYQVERNARGELEIMSPSGGKGSRWESRVIRELDQWAEEHGGAAFSSAGGFHLPDGSVLSPDAAWVSEARWNALTDEQQRRFPPLCPDFLVEILSESDRLGMLKAKMQMWMENGAQLAWMIDPYEQTVRVYRAGSGAELLVLPEFVEAGEPVAGFRLNLAAMWQQ